MNRRNMTWLTLIVAFSMAWVVAQWPGLDSHFGQVTRAEPPAENTKLPSPSASELRKIYEAKEKETLKAARKFQKAQTLDPGVPGARQSLESAKAHLKNVVAEAFSARQQVHAAELAEFRHRMTHLEKMIAERERIREDIINRRVEDLLNPDLRWDGETSDQKLKPSGRVATVPPAPIAEVPSVQPNAVRETGKLLTEAVREFNALYRQHPIGGHQPPLTDDEIIAAVAWYQILQDAASDPGRVDHETLDAITKHFVLPENAVIEAIVQMPLDTEGEFECWSIQLTVRNPSGAPKVLPIRERFIRSKAGAEVANESGEGVGEPDPNGIPLAAAIRAFNEQYRGDTIGKDQLPLTEAEVIAAVRYWKHKRNEAPVSIADFKAFQSIAEMRVMPVKSEIEVIKMFRPDQRQEFDAWSVRIRVPKKDGSGSFAYSIRERWIRTRSFGDPSSSSSSVSWGPPGENGLQAGLRLEPRNESYSPGQVIQTRFYLKNTSDKAIELSTPRLMTHSYYKSVRVLDDQGSSISLDQNPEIAGPVGWLVQRLGPGEHLMIHGLPLSIADQRPSDNSVETAIGAKPGQVCRIRFTLNNYAAANSGELATGEVRFSISSLTP